MVGALCCVCCRAHPGLSVRFLLLRYLLLCTVESLTPHSTGRRFRYAHGDHRISLKFFSKSPRKRRQPHDLGAWRFHFASTLYCASVTLPLRFCYDPTTTMKIRLRLVYADGDAAATYAMELRLLCTFVSFLYKIRSLTDVCLVECHPIDALKSPCFGWPLWTTDYVGWSEAQARWSRRAKRYVVCPWFSADRRLQCGHFDQLIRAMSMEDGSSFFNYMRMECPELLLESKRATPTLGEHLNKAWSWPERQERIRSANVDYA